MTPEEASAVATELSAREDALLATFNHLQEAGADPRWIAIARTHLQQGFMAAKRACFDGKRVTDTQ